MARAGANRVRFRAPRRPRRYRLALVATGGGRRAVARAVLVVRRRA